MSMSISSGDREGQYEKERTKKKKIYKFLGIRISFLFILSSSLFSHARLSNRLQYKTSLEAKKKKKNQTALYPPLLPLP